MNIGNLMLNSTTANNSVNTSKVSSAEIGSNQRAFVNMMMLMVENSLKKGLLPEYENSSNLDIKDLISVDEQENRDDTNNNVISILSGLMYNPLGQINQDLELENIICNTIQNVGLQQDSSIQTLFLNNNDYDENSVFNKEGINIGNSIFNEYDISSKESMMQIIKTETASEEDLLTKKDFDALAENTSEKRPSQISKNETVYTQIQFLKNNFDAPTENMFEKQPSHILRNETLVEIENLNLMRDKGVEKVLESAAPLFEKIIKSKDSIIYNTIQNVGLQQDSSIQTSFLNNNNNDENSVFNKEGINIGNSIFNEYDISSKESMMQIIKTETDSAEDLLTKNDFDAPTVNTLEKQPSQIFEKIINSKDGNKDEVDFNPEIVNSNSTVFTDYNRIIEVSDESSRINQSVLSQVEDKISLMIKDGTQQVNMELFPENLGKVNIKMTIVAGKMTVDIMTLNEKTGNILASNAHELTKALQDNFNNGTVQVIVTDNILNQYNQSSLNYHQQQDGREGNSRSRNLNDTTEDIDEDCTITEMINLRNLKLNKVV